MFLQPQAGPRSIQPLWHSEAARETDRRLGPSIAISLELELHCYLIIWDHQNSTVCNMFTYLTRRGSHFVQQTYRDYSVQSSETWISNSHAPHLVLICWPAVFYSGTFGGKLSPQTLELPPPPRICKPVWRQTNLMLKARLTQLKLVAWPRL